MLKTHFSEKCVIYRIKTLVNIVKCCININSNV
nr:MAG TPA: hypothetical protein [Caudoviricetes sp.]